MNYTIDLADLSAPSQFHQKIRRILPCPEWYGDNLDALYDLLTEFGSGWHIQFIHAASMAQSLPAYEAALQKLCCRAVAETPTLSITFSD